MVTIVERTDWGAVPPKSTASTKSYTRHVPSWITVHHSATLASGYKGASTIRAIQTYHMSPQAEDSSKPWYDVGYQYFIGPDGVIYRGRPEDVVGSHVKALNTGNIGICLIGNFSTKVGFERPTQKAIDSLIALCADVCFRRKIDPLAKIIPHRTQQDNKDCPGANLEGMLPAIRLYVRDQVVKLQGQPLPAPVTTGAPTVLVPRLPDIQVDPEIPSPPKSGGKPSLSSDEVLEIMNRPSPSDETRQSNLIIMALLLAAAIVFSTQGK